MISKKLVTTAILFFQLLAFSSLLSANEKTTTDAELSIPFEISPTGHPVVTLMYGEKPIRMILDTAAGANVFSQKATTRLELTVKNSDEKAAGLGTQAYAMAEVSPIVVALGEKKLRLQDLITMDLSHVEVAGGGKGFDGLLGSPFFREFRVKIDFGNNTIALNMNGKQPALDSDDKSATSPELSVEGGEK